MKRLVEGLRFKRSWKLKLRTLLLLSALFLTALYAFLIGMQFYRSSLDYLQRVYSSQGKDTLTYTSQALEEDLLRLSSAAAELRYNAAFSQRLADYDDSDIRGRLDTQNELSSMLAMLQIVNKNIGTLAVFTENSVFCDGEFSLLGQDLQDLRAAFFPEGFPEKAALLVPDRSPLAKESLLQTASLEILRYRFCVVVPFYENQTRSVLCVILRKDYLEKLLSDTDDMAVLHEDGAVLYNSTSRPDSVLVSAAREKPGDSVATVERFSELQLVYTGVEEMLETQMSRIMTFMLSFYSLVLTISLLAAERFARRITIPISQLMERMNPRSVLSDSGPRQPLPGKSISLRESVMYYLLSVVLISSAVISVISISFFSRFLETAATDLLRGSFDHAYKNTQNLTDNLLSTTRYLIYEDDTQAVLSAAYQGEPWDAGNLSKNLTDRQLYQYDTAVGLYGADGQPVYLSDIYALPSASDPGRYAASAYWETTVFGRSRHMVALYSTIFEKIASTRESIGSIFVLTDESVFKDQYDHLLSQQCQAVLCNQDGLIVSHPNKNLIGTQWEPVYSEAGSIEMSASIPKTPFKLIVLFDQSIIEAERTSFLVSIGYLFVILIMALMLCSSLIAYILGKSFQRFSQRMAEAGAGSLSPRDSSDSVIWEISQLFTLFNSMSEQIRQSTADMLEANRSRHELVLAHNMAQYQILQSQINPHFLYNTFESISFMIRRGDKDEAIEMLCELSDMLRFAARQGETVVLLTEEIAYTRKYIRIMQTRYGGAIEFNICFDDSTWELCTPKFFLQPLVENAIRHGVRPLGSGHIQLTGSAAGDRLVIVVRDDGVGISPQRLADITRQMSDGDKTGSIGLPNIQRRLRSMYGEPYGLYVVSEPGGGTSVTVILPVVRRQGPVSDEHDRLSQGRPRADEEKPEE